MPFEYRKSDDQPNDQATAITKMKERLSKFETEEGRLKGFRFAPRKTDVFIVASPKAGTTWMQQITHQLRTKGDMEFGR